MGKIKKTVPERLAAHMWGGKAELQAGLQEGQCSRTMGDDNLWYYSWRELKVGTNQGRRNEAAIVGQKDLTEKQAELGDKVLASLKWDDKTTKAEQKALVDDGTMPQKLEKRLIQAKEAHTNALTKAEKVYTNMSGGAKQSDRAKKEFAEPIKLVTNNKRKFEDYLIFDCTGTTVATVSEELKASVQALEDLWQMEKVCTTYTKTEDDE